MMITETLVQKAEKEYGMSWLYEDSRYALMDFITTFINDRRFFDDMDILKEASLDLIVAANMAEAHFQKPFDGWLPKSGTFGATTLRPYHVDYTTASENEWYWTSDGSSGPLAFQEWFSVETDQTEVLFIYGYFNTSLIPNTRELQFTAGGKQLPVWNIEQLFSKQDRYFLLPRTITIDINSTFKGEASVRSLSTVESMGLIGIYFSTEGRLVRQSG